MRRDTQHSGFLWGEYYLKVTECLEARIIANVISRVNKPHFAVGGDATNVGLAEFCQIVAGFPAIWL